MQVAVSGEMVLASWSMEPELTGDDVGIARDGVNADREHMTLTTTNDARDYLEAIQGF